MQIIPMDTVNAAYLPHDMAYPMRYVLDPALVQSEEASPTRDRLAALQYCPFPSVRPPVSINITHPNGNEISIDSVIEWLKQN